MTQQPTHSRSRQRGFGLIELMIGVLIGLFVIGGALNVFLSGTRSFRTNESASRMQENARIAFELFARDMREAGGNPCGSLLVANALSNASSNWWSDWSSGPLLGVAANSASPLGAQSAGTAAASRVAATDAVIIRTATSDNNPLAIQYSTGTDHLEVTQGANHGLQLGDVVMACGNKHALIFQVTSDGTADIQRGATGNCSAGGFDYVAPPVCPSAGDASQMAGGYLTKLGAMHWYVANNGRDGRSLYRQTIAASSGALTQPTVEMVEGVQSMRLRYLIEGQTTYLAADDATFTGTPANWKQVVAVQVELDLVSTEQTGSNASGAKAALGRTVTFVVRLRNAGANR